MRALTAAVILLSLGPELRSQTAVRPVDDGVPHYSSNAVGTQFAALWRERARPPYVCLVGRGALDASSPTFFQVDSLRVAGEPLGTCHGSPGTWMVQVGHENPAPLQA